MFQVAAIMLVSDLHCSFGLFEGMSAIEMMDPKMDAGMMCNQTKHKVFSFSQAVKVEKTVMFDYF